MGSNEAEVTAKASVMPSRRDQRKQEAVKLMPPPPSLPPPARTAAPAMSQPQASTSGYTPPPWAGQPPRGVSLQVLKDGVPVQDIPLHLPATVFGRSASHCCLLASCMQRCMPAKCAIWRLYSRPLPPTTLPSFRPPSPAPHSPFPPWVSTSVPLLSPSSGPQALHGSSRKALLSRNPPPPPLPHATVLQVCVSLLIYGIRSVPALDRCACWHRSSRLLPPSPPPPPPPPRPAGGPPPPYPAAWTLHASSSMALPPATVLSRFVDSGTPVPKSQVLRNGSLAGRQCPATTQVPVGCGLVQLLPMSQTSSCSAFGCTDACSQPRHGCPAGMR